MTPFYPSTSGGLVAPGKDWSGDGPLREAEFAENLSGYQKQRVPMSSSKHIGHQVIAMMDRLGVSPITRNYHLFYTCIANTNPALRQAVRNLGRFPSQHQLDQVIDEFCPEAVDSGAMARHEALILNAMRAFTSDLKSEQEQLGAFHKAIERVTAALARSAKQDGVGTELLKKVVSAIGEAGRSRILSGDRTIARIDRNRDEVDSLREELIVARQMANTDALTGLANRRSFDDSLAKAVGKGAEFALIVADIDYFKRLNDAYGHPFGDHCLKAIAATLRNAMRAGTYLARTGGEEFAILLSSTRKEEVLSVAERARASVESLKLRKVDHEVTVTISLGVALSNQAHTANGIYEAADGALYHSKNAGRNRVTFYNPAEDESSSSRYQLYGRFA